MYKIHFRWNKATATRIHGCRKVMENQNQNSLDLIWALVRLDPIRWLSPGLGNYLSILNGTTVTTCCLCDRAVQAKNSKTRPYLKFFDFLTILEHAIWRWPVKSYFVIWLFKGSERVTTEQTLTNTNDVFSTWNQTTWFHDQNKPVFARVGARIKMLSEE